METLFRGRIAKALQKSPYLDLTMLTYETNGGCVVLRGIVPSYFEKQMAQESIRWVEGVDEIFNELEVLGC